MWYYQYLSCKVLKFNLLSISWMQILKFTIRENKYVIGDASKKFLLPERRDKNVYVLDSVKNFEEHLCLTSIS